MSSEEEITRLLADAAGGDDAALDRLFPLVYEELRGMARRRLHHERPDHTLGATGLVHEAYLKLVRLNRIDWKTRGHFFAVAARAMRNVLVDHAVRRKAQKRGGGPRKVSLEQVELMTLAQADELLALDQALQRLASRDARQSRVVECRFFGGLTIEETADVLGISTATVSREWLMARAWLNRELSAGPPTTPAHRPDTA